MSWLSKQLGSVSGFDMGTPQHGIKAGLSAFKVFSPTMMLYDSYKGYQDGGLKGALMAGPHAFQNAFKDNWPALLAAGGVAAGGVSGLSGSGATNGAMASGSASEAGGSLGGLLGGGGGGGSSPMLQQGLGLLGGGQSQQQPASVVQAPPMQRDNSAQLRMQQELALQALRQKPNKTLEEWQQLQAAIQNQGLLGDPYG